MLIKVVNGQAEGAPVLEDNFRQLYPNISFPLVLTSAIVAPYGYGMYEFSQVPEVGPYQKLVEDPPLLDQYGIWRQSWRVETLTGQALEARKTEIKAGRWEEIKRLRDLKTQQGGYKVGTHWFHSDTFSRTQQIGLTIMGASVPAGLMWKTMSGNFVAMTPTLAQQIFAAAGAQDTALFAHAETLKAQMEASADPAAFDITVGWPETFGGV